MTADGTGRSSVGGSSRCSRRNPWPATVGTSSCQPGATSQQLAQVEAGCLRLRARVTGEIAIWIPDRDLKVHVLLLKVFLASFQLMPWNAAESWRTLRHESARCVGTGHNLLRRSQGNCAVHRQGREAVGRSRKAPGPGARSSTYYTPINDATAATRTEFQSKFFQDPTIIEINAGLPLADSR